MVLRRIQRCHKMEHFQAESLHDRKAYVQGKNLTTSLSYMGHHVVFGYLERGGGAGKPFNNQTWPNFPSSYRLASLLSDCDNNDVRISEDSATVVA